MIRGDSSEVRVRLKQEGPNELPAQKKRSLLAIVLEVVREPTFIMLIVAGSLYLTLEECGHASRGRPRCGDRADQVFPWPTRDSLFALWA
jgi:hypothetical protein